MEQAIIQQQIAEIFTNASLIDLREGTDNEVSLEYLRSSLWETLINLTYTIDRNAANEIIRVIDESDNDYEEAKKEVPSSETGGDPHTELQEKTRFLYNLQLDYKKVVLTEIREILYNYAILN